MSPLIGVAVGVAGFLLRLHPLAVVLLAALAAYGHAYDQNRFRGEHGLASFALLALEAPHV